MANLKRNKHNVNKNLTNIDSNVDETSSFFASNSAGNGDTVTIKKSDVVIEDNSDSNSSAKNSANSIENSGLESLQDRQNSDNDLDNQNSGLTAENKSSIAIKDENESVIVKDGVSNASFGLNGNGHSQSDNEDEVQVKAKHTKKLKKSTKQRMRTIGILTVLGIFTGSGLGVWYFNNAVGPIIDYSQYNENDYIVSAESVLGKYGVNSDYENWLTQLKNNNDITSPADLSPAENFILAEFNASLADTFHIVGNGKVTASVFGISTSQSVYSEKNYDGGYYTFESISDGMLKIGKCSVMRKDTDGVRLYSSSNITNGGKDAVWNDYQDYSNEGYIALAGSTPDGIQSYIISDKTIIDQSEVVYDEESGYYSFTVDLDPITSVLRYVRQVQQTSGLSSLPTFSSVSQTITIDENWNLISISIEEEYSVIYGVSASCSGNLTSYYDFGMSEEEIKDFFPVDPYQINFNV